MYYLASVLARIHLPIEYSVRLLALHASGSGSTPDRSHPTLAHSSASSLRVRVFDRFTLFASPLHSLRLSCFQVGCDLSRIVGTCCVASLSANYLVATVSFHSTLLSACWRRHGREPILACRSSGMLPAESLAFVDYRLLGALSSLVLRTAHLTE